MVRTIKIGDKTYDLKSSAYTMFAYKDITGSDLLKDIKTLNEKKKEIDKIKDKMQWLEEIMPLMEKTLKLAHIMIKEQDPKFKDDTTWILDVLEVGISPFFRGIQSAPKQR